ncbi:Domain of uncharacterised function (DUF477) [Mycobacteroides abscessus]|uniref:Domain of uncharacterized function (DUF477) n=2 Tax=Mycobacteroides abscessus TaxID=36809 RepID=A0A0U0ZR01_9MYCO|nr:Domain of uncharacterised function (DUF477) [Mycobacteroides abscessus]
MSVDAHVEDTHTVAVSWCQQSARCGAQLRRDRVDKPSGGPEESIRALVVHTQQPRPDYRRWWHHGSMKHTVRLWCTALLLGAAALTSSAVAAHANPAPAPVTTAALVDDAHLFDASDSEQAVLRAMTDFSARTAMTITVVTTDDSGGQGVQTYATARAAALGRDQGEAVVIGADMGTRHVGIYTTPGAEKRVPQSETDRINSDVLTSGFKQGHYSDAIVFTLDAINGYVHGDKSSQQRQPVQMWPLLAVGGVGVLGLAGAAAAFATRRSAKRDAARAEAFERRSAEVKSMTPELKKLSSPRDRYQLAKARTGVSVHEWNQIFPNWYYTAAVMSSTSSSSSSYMPSSSTSSVSSFSSGFSAGGFDGGGASTGSF